MLSLDLVFVEQEPMAGRVLTMEPGAVIGREGCDIVLPDPEVSRRHAMIQVEGPVASIQDLGSTNGTYVNGHLTAGPVELHQGDTLRFGNTVWRVETPSAVTRIAPGLAGSG